MEKIEDRLKKLYEKVEAEIEIAERQIRNKVKFDFSIVHQIGDGVCILNNDTDQVAPLDDCMRIIRENGKLTFQDFNKYSI